MNHKFIEPFEIEMFIEKQIYRLRLFKFYQIHNVFYVFLFEPYRGRFATKSLSLPILINEKKHYEIEKILNSRIHRKKLQYLVK